MVSLVIWLISAFVIIMAGVFAVFVLGMVGAYLFIPAVIFFAVFFIYAHPQLYPLWIFIGVLFALWLGGRIHERFTSPKPPSKGNSPNQPTWPARASLHSGKGH